MLTFDDAADRFTMMANGVRRAPVNAGIMVAPLLAASMREQFGHAPPLQDLAQSTQIERAQLGYEPNEPLIRTHSLQESYVDDVFEGDNGIIAFAGSRDPIALYQEEGTATIPPRPAALLGFLAVQPMAQTIWRNIVGVATGLR